MLIQLIGEILGSAIGVAISPLPIVGLILSLFSKSPLRNSVAFLMGWLVLNIVMCVVILLTSQNAANAAEDATIVQAVSKIAVGLLFLYMAYRQWTKCPRPGYEPEMPKWMAAIEGESGLQAFGLAVVLALTNPKNIGMSVTAINTITHADVDTVGRWVAFAVFILVGASPLILPIVYYMVGGEGAKVTLNRMKTWLVHYNAVVLLVMFALLGAQNLGGGVALL